MIGRINIPEQCQVVFVKFSRHLAKNPLNRIRRIEGWAGLVSFLTHGSFSKFLMVVPKNPVNPIIR
jgi:hypothetical protein